MDDIQDFFDDNAQLEAMNLFISKGQPLSLGIVTKDIGNDLRITGKVGQGIKAGLFELGLHGWDHIDYTKLSEAEQKSMINIANEKMEMMFGNMSDIFIPPYGDFNKKTVNALEQLGIGILSAALFSEENLDNGESIFNKTKSTNTVSAEEKLSEITSFGDAQPDGNEVFHLPGMVTFKGYVDEVPIKVPIDKIISEVSKNMAEFGYSVIVFHPQDLVQINNSDLLNSTEMDDLSQLIDTLLSKGIKISTFSEIAGIEPRAYSYFRPSSEIAGIEPRAYSYRPTNFPVVKR